MQDSENNDGKAKSSAVAKPFNRNLPLLIDKAPDAKITREEAFKMSINALSFHLSNLLPSMKAFDELKLAAAALRQSISNQNKDLQQALARFKVVIEAFHERVNNVHLDEVDFVKKQRGLTVKLREDGHNGFFWYLILIMDRNNIGPAEASEDYIRSMYFQYVGEEIAKREEMIEKSKLMYGESFAEAKIVIEVPESKKALTRTTTKSINEIAPLNLRDLTVPELAVYCIVSERFGLIESFDAAREGRVKAIANFAKKYGKSGDNLRKQMDALRKLSTHSDNIQRLKTITPFIQHSKEAMSFVEAILKVLETSHL